MKTSWIFIVILLIVACTEPEPRKPISRKTSTFLKESIERNQAINKAEETELKRLMELDSLNRYIASPYGFWYYYQVKDSISNRFPVKGDQVTYEYAIADIYGEQLYSKEALGVRNYLVDKEELITGLQDGIKLMKEGETVTFLFPSHKAYGYSGYQKIGSNQPLRYTVTLKKITTK
ncbi:MAG: gliding motility-associated peptidyl-prolyl isomerase GldI [Flavobacteriaceae bacterium]|nr:gliding motility-associated peptidyl-prolyl isomerase GldI [Flavobacteriaceae bacterium]